MICSNILEAMGHTPVIRLSRMTGPDMAEVLVKFEGLNVGGSIKTRTACADTAPLLLCRTLSVKNDVSWYSIMEHR